MSTEDNRIIVWVSAGVPSAVAWKMAVDLYGKDRVSGVYCDTSKTESQDNQRFLSEVSAWVGQELRVIKSEKYDTVDDVFEARQYMSGIKGAPCTVEMKKIPRFKFQRPDDKHVFGFTAEEGKRVKFFENNNPELTLEWILINRGITRDWCMEIIKDAGIAIPIRYSQGFENNNCLCCVKASSFAYWVMERRINPDVFARRAEQSRRIGARLTRYNGKRIFLDEIPPDDEIMMNGKPLKIVRSTEKISCGPECGGPVEQSEPTFTIKLAERSSPGGPE